MRTRDKVAICRRFKEGEPMWKLGLDAWFDGLLSGSLCDARERIEFIIREAMNGAPWWPPRDSRTRRSRKEK